VSAKIPGFKIPVSVLVVIHTPDLQVLLIERARNPGYWQSVTGSLDAIDEPPRDAAIRELMEETGIDALAPGHVLRDWKHASTYEIYPTWRDRYAPGVTTNLEHVFSVQVPAVRAGTLAPDEHVAQLWLPYEAAADKVFSPSNRTAILRLPAWRGVRS
jgi:dATP pyrophosphohydrolase